MKPNITGTAALLCAIYVGSSMPAQAFCTPSWADVTILCPQPVPYPGPKILTPTSGNLPTVGTSTTYRNWVNGRDVRVYLQENGTGYQEFHWAVPTDYGKRP